ncbi:hypothetical protein I6J71_07990 [Amycolatopsis sp. FDAARGOS 1241]|nr:hypothetical protein [Amycolatopsis sp. FDAARGOS 1241]QRP47845.1 hypothetical protein I6J71_07990 [Amycolatopsis sp. FDAARGOS 1241]
MAIPRCARNCGLSRSLRHSRATITRGHGGEEENPAPLARVEEHRHERDEACGGERTQRPGRLHHREDEAAVARNAFVLGGVAELVQVGRVHRLLGQAQPADGANGDEAGRPPVAAVTADASAVPLTVAIIPRRRPIRTTIGPIENNATAVPTLASVDTTERTIPTSRTSPRSAAAACRTG